MSAIETRERETYETAWAFPQYGEFAPGAELARVFFDVAKPDTGATVLDAGCGTGKGALVLRAAKLRVTMTDLTNEGLVDEARDIPFVRGCLWNNLPTGYRFGGKFDYVYCCDVLEHVPTPFTMLVVANLLRVARRGVFLTISLAQDQFGPWIGKPLHQTVQSFVSWRDQLAEVGDVIEARDLLTTGVYYVRPR